MKILHVITSLRTGGAEKLMVDLLPRFEAKGLDVELLLFDGIATPFRKAAEEAGIKIYDFGTGGSVYHPKNLLRLLPFLKKYDIIHTHNTAPQLFAAIGSLFGSGKLVTTEHNTSNRRRKWRWYAKIDRWMYSRYNKVICISQKAEENLREFIGQCNTEILTINNGVDTKKYINAQPSNYLEELAPESKKIIMVAGFRWEKDQPTIIRALKYLPENFHFFLVGDGPRREEYFNLTKSENVENRVHFLGLRTDVPQLLHAADYVVMSSHFEGLSLSSVEGMCVGKPFLASDVDGLREVVKDDGVLFLHEDSKALATQIKLLDSSQEKYASVAQQCMKRALQYDISNMVEDYVNTYETLCQL